MAHRTRYSPRVRKQVGSTNRQGQDPMASARRLRVPAVELGTDDATGKAVPRPPPKRPSAARPREPPRRPSAGVGRFNVAAGEGPSSRAASGSGKRTRRRPGGMLAWPADADTKPKRGFSPRHIAALGRDDDDNRGNWLTEPDVVIDTLREHFKNAPYASFRKFFKDLDTDGSGTLTIGEITTGLRQIFPGMSIQQSCGLMGKMDIDYSGDINFHEMFDYLCKEVRREEHNPDALPIYLCSEEEHRREVPLATREFNTEMVVKALLDRVGDSGARTVFQELDTNGDGVISRSEFRTGLQKMQLGIGPEHITELIELLDTEKNGVIDFDEFASHLEDKSGVFARIMAKGKPNPVAKRPADATKEGNDPDFLNRPQHLKFLAALAKDRADVVESLPTTFTKVREVFLKLDKGQHGFVKREDLQRYFTEAIKPVSGYRLHRQDAERLALLCDHNGDGYVQVSDALSTLRKLSLIARNGGDETDDMVGGEVDVAISPTTLEGKVPTLDLSGIVGQNNPYTSARSHGSKTPFSARSASGRDSVFSRTTASSLSTRVYATADDPTFKQILRSIKTNHAPPVTRRQFKPRAVDTRSIVQPESGPARVTSGETFRTSAALMTADVKNITESKRRRVAVANRPSVLADVSSSGATSARAFATGTGRMAPFASPFAIPVASARA